MPCYSMFKSKYLTLAQLDLLGSARTGASALDRLVTISRIMLSIRFKISWLDIEILNEVIISQENLFQPMLQLMSKTNCSLEL